MGLLEAAALHFCLFLIIHNNAGGVYAFVGRVGSTRLFTYNYNAINNRAVGTHPLIESLLNADATSTGTSTGAPSPVESPTSDTAATTAQQAINAASSTTSQRLSSNQDALEELYPNYPRTWVPLGSTSELDPNRPTPVLFLDQSYVTYQINNETNGWVVLDNVCPHRLAPLSE